MAQVIGSGICEGVPYIVVVKDDGKIYIGLQPATAGKFMVQGANMKLLNNIGEQNPDDVIRSLLASIPAK